MHTHINTTIKKLLNGMTVSISVICSPLLEGVTPLELVMLEGSGLMGIRSGGYEHLKEEFIRAGND